MSKHIVWPVGRYRLTQKAYIRPHPDADFAVMEEGATVLWDGMPGPHMEPIDEQAEANMRHAHLLNGGPQTLDPTELLSLVMGEVEAGKSALAAAPEPAIPPPAPVSPRKR